MLEVQPTSKSSVTMTLKERLELAEARIAALQQLIFALSLAVCDLNKDAAHGVIGHLRVLENRRRAKNALTGEIEAISFVVSALEKHTGAGRNRRRPQNRRMPGD